VRIECVVRSSLCCVSIRLFEITHSPLTVPRAFGIVAGHGNPMLIRNSRRSSRETHQLTGRALTTMILMDERTGKRRK
jgi:hypothetical protein